MAGGGVPTATNIATSACDGTYLGGREGREQKEGRKGGGWEKGEKGGKGGDCRIFENI